MTDIFLLFQAQAAVPDAFYIGINLLVLVILLALSGLVSGSEVAFFSLSPENIEEADKRDGLGYALLPKLNQNPKNLLATILILNNFINVAIVTLSTIFTWNLFALEDNPKGLAVAILTVVVTILIVFIGEVIPKVYASQQVLRFAAFTAPLLNASMSIFRPLAWLLINMSKIIERRIQHKGYDISVNELTHALEITENFSSSEEEKEILKGIVNFGTLTVRQIMTSRIDITAVDIEINFHELMDRVNKTGFSRLPVYNETIDKIEGILYIKDFLAHIENDEYFEWQQLIRPPFFVPENKRVDKLLSDFQQKRVHVAIVVDEYGGTQGLITMEDIIEEIVGELDDEFDDETVFHQRVDTNTFVFEGKVSLNDFCKVIQVDQEIFDEVKGESESLAGLILELLGRIPGPGERIKYQNFLFTVIAVDNRRIKRVRVFMDPETAKDPAEFID